MSSEVPIPRTAVPFGIDDPVVQARTELKAALAAIEYKANVPRRVSTAVDLRVDQARRFSRSNPVAATIAVVAGAAAVGAAVWAAVRSYSR